MPILYATAANLTKRSDDDFILMETTSWYDNEHMIFLKDYQQVNTLDYLNLIDQDTPIISIVIKNEKNINLNQIINLKNLEHLSLESIESITFCDLNPSLKHLEITYCALAYAPQIPSKLIILDLSMNLIKSLDEIDIHENLRTINLNDNHFTNFPKLPDSVEVVYMCSNYLNKIDNFPKNLKKIFLKNNYLKNGSIPSLENIYSDIDITPMIQLNI